jgi:hypothetical protein
VVYFNVKPTAIISEEFYKIMVIIWGIENWGSGIAAIKDMID